MSALALLPSSSTAAPPPASDAAGVLAARGGRRTDEPVAAVARSTPPRNGVQGRHVRPDPRDAQRALGRGRAGPAGPGARAGAGPAAERPLGASARFLIQVLAQDLGPPAGPLAQHRDGAVLGSDAYRRAGGQPPLYSQRPTVFRITV
ncbi:MAG: hypothetical protein ACE5GS_15535 [Kiloniellaceae bacterium]